MLYLLSYLGLSIVETNKNITESLILQNDEEFRILNCRFMNIQNGEAPIYFRAESLTYSHSGSVQNCVFDSCSGADANTIILIFYEASSEFTLSRLCMNSCHSERGCGIWNLNPSSVEIGEITCYNAKSSNYSSQISNNFKMTKCNFTELISSADHIFVIGTSTYTIDFTCFAKCDSANSLIKSSQNSATITTCNFLSNEVKNENPLILFEGRSGILIENSVLIGNTVANNHFIKVVSTPIEFQITSALINKFAPKDDDEFTNEYGTIGDNDYIRLGFIPIESCIESEEEDIPSSSSSSSDDSIIIQPSQTIVPTESSPDNSTKKTIIIASSVAGALIIIIIVIVIIFLICKNKKKDEPQSCEEDVYDDEYSSSQEETLKAENATSNQQDNNGCNNNDEASQSVNVVYI